MSEQSPPRIAWDKVPLPLLRIPGYSLKDPALIWDRGRFHLYFSVFDQHNHSRLVGMTSPDLIHWDGPTLDWGHGAAGWCSPDVVRDGDRFIMTFQSWDAVPPRESRNQLFYAQTTNPAAGWSEPQPLAENLTRGVRAIDAALAKHHEEWFLLYKEAQTPRMATATNLDGEWTQLANPLPVWAENGQFICIDGHWHLLATIQDHAQGLASMLGRPDELEAWLSWSDFQVLNTPLHKGFNEATPANASSLWDGREVDGYWYRVFCAAQNPTDNNAGYELGIVRSKDLAQWELPGVNVN